LSEAVIDSASAFDYEHSEQLSPGDCRVTLSDGRLVILSGRESPRPQPEAEEHQTISETFWNNTGGSSYGAQKSSWQTATTGAIVGNGNAVISSTTEMPLELSYPYTHFYCQRYEGGHHVI
jgi:hypothetical protein